MTVEAPTLPGIGNKLEDAYRVWIAKHPEIWALYLRFAREALGHGKPFNVALLTERIRWEVRLKDGPGFKVNNNHRAYIARDLIAAMPALDGILETRAVEGEEA